MAQMIELANKYTKSSMNVVSRFLETSTLSKMMHNETNFSMG